MATVKILLWEDDRTASDEGAINLVIRVSGHLKPATNGHFKTGHVSGHQ